MLYRSAKVALALAATASAAACPYMAVVGGDYSGSDVPASHAPVQKRQNNDATQATADFLGQHEINDDGVYLTSDVGGPFEDQQSLSAGERGPTLLEDFIFRQKIQHFDHERIPERAVHARGAGAHGVFESYADWSNITGASFLNAPGKQTPVFVRFSTVAGSRGSADTARDVHGFALRFYTDEGNFDIVGNNIPVFFIQDAIQFPDLIHAVKPSPDSEIPQAATAHDTAWDFFSQQPSSLATLFWAMAPNGIPRSFRHMNGFGIHTFRFVTDDGRSKFVKFHHRSLTGTTSLVWEEAQIVSGKNADFHRQDLFDSIENGRFPSWEFSVQIFDEEDQLRWGFDVLDPTKIIPEELVPLTPLGRFTLNRNPRNYFAETEQVMFQPGHIVRGIDFSDDPLLQGRIFSYLDTQLNRNLGSPNFEQIPINQPRVPWHNNNRDGAGQMFIPLNTAAYSPNTLNNASPMQANQTVGRGFFTAPNRTVSGALQRTLQSTFTDVWSQPRLFYNSLGPVEQQFLINAIRFELSNVQSSIVKNNVLIQLNRISHDIAARVAETLGLQAPDADPTYYNDNTTVNVAVFGKPLLSLAGLRVGLLTTENDTTDYSSLQGALAAENVDLYKVAETFNTPSVNQTYTAADATGFDALVVAGHVAPTLFRPFTSSPEYPSGRPLSILLDAYRWGKPVGELGNNTVFANAGLPSGDGVYTGGDINSTANSILDGLRTFKFLDRFPVDQGYDTRRKR